jgi:hypothetical protein
LNTNVQFSACSFLVSVSFVFAFKLLKNFSNHFHHYSIALPHISVCALWASEAKFLFRPRILFAFFLSGLRYVATFCVSPSSLINRLTFGLGAADFDIYCLGKFVTFLVCWGAFLCISHRILYYNFGHNYKRFRRGFWFLSPD